MTYWNAYVANTQMVGKGTFFDPRLKNRAQFPAGAAAGFHDLRHTPDLVTEKLAALHFYRLAIPAPTPPKGSFVMTCQAAAPECVHGVFGDDGVSGERNVANFSAGVRPWRAIENRSKL